MIVATLCVLALLDAAFAGFRAAAGRNLRISKWRYYARAMLGGCVAGFIAMALEGALAFALLDSSAQPDALYAAFVRGGAIMLAWYAPYAAIVLAALFAYVSVAYEVRSLAIVLVLGPLTLLRPVLVLGGALHASLREPTAAVAAFGGAALVLATGRVLDWLHSRR